MAEFILTKDMFKHIDAEYPDLPNTELARMVGRNESGLRKKRKQTKLELGVADHLLTKLDLNHLLSDGTIPIYLEEQNG